MHVATSVLSRVNLKVKLFNFFIEETIRTTCMAVVTALIAGLPTLLYKLYIVLGWYFHGR